MKYLRHLTAFSALLFLFSCSTIPSACFDVPATVTEDTPVEFSSACSENGKTYHWDFGDGNTSNEESPTHTFTSSGSFTVVLKVSNGKNESEVTRVVEVEPATGKIVFWKKGLSNFSAGEVQVYYDGVTPFNQTLNVNTSSQPACGSAQGTTFEVPVGHAPFKFFSINTLEMIPYDVTIQKDQCISYEIAY